MTSLYFFVQPPDRTSILAKGVFLVLIIGRSLLLNHSPSEWFSLYNKKPTVRRQSVYRKEGENEENFAFGELFAGAFDQNYIDLKAASGTAR